ncbi:MAG: endopeptidase La [Phycisphaeraceae bacterium]|nr:endopeptidase La [Phycisphaeraceae bacterium]
MSKSSADNNDPGQEVPEKPGVAPIGMAVEVDEDGSGPEIPSTLPVMPIRGAVMFPGTVIPLSVGRPSSRRLLDESLPESKMIALVTQRDDDDEDPDADGLFDVATAATVLKLIRQPDETVSVIVHGVERVNIDRMIQRKPFFRAEVSVREEVEGRGKAFEAAVNQMREQAAKLLELTPETPEQAMAVLMNIEEPGALADFLAANLNLEIEQKQDLLEERDVAKRVRAVHQYVSNQLEIARLQQKIQQDVQSSISDSQRKMYLREQMKAIREELDDGDGDQAVEKLRQRIEEADPPEEVMAEAERELDRLAAIPSASPEYAMLTSYLELLGELPWRNASEDRLDLDAARKVLDRDHFDLDKVKRRLLEFLAVRKLNPDGRSPILCLVGPPGVGKTSLGESIADAMGRSFARLSLGGIRDEAEVRGHRRTYIGAMPGRIIQELRRAGTNNPVMMLDEVDKLGSDFRGDPSSALLEVLDPKQNDKFVDRYLDVPFDLSDVIFICTANYLGNVPPPLRDRMEVIDIAGYTDRDKLQIAKKYLVPRQLEENGLVKSTCTWRADAIRKVITDYTREAGVRELERQIGAVCRGVAAQIAREEYQSRTVNEKLVRELLGPEKYFRELDVRTRVPGIVIGLAYTPVGGEVLFVEATTYPGKGNVTLTGQIGDVMKESASAAMSLFKSRADRYNFDVNALATRDVHIHVPAGAVPKDGPSAGVAMYTAIASLMFDLPVKERLGMTGEITLRGRVLPIGGVKEKTLAAARVGVKTILLPEANRRDMENVDETVKKQCRFEFVENVDQVLEAALGKKALARVKKKGATPPAPALEA